MELNETYKAYQSKINQLEGNEKPADALRDFYLSIENLFDEIKSSKSSRDFKWLFLLLLSLVLFANSFHIAKYSFGFNLIPLLLLLAFWIYYRYTLKQSIAHQSSMNKKLDDEKSNNSDQKSILQTRVQYILNGTEVLRTRIMLIRNQYVIFFPIFTLLVIDIIKGPLSISAFITTFVIAVIVGGIFWIYYFKNDLTDLENSEEELMIIQEKLNAT